jgi:hypothetical protein
LEGGTTPLPIVYYMPLCGDYIQISLFFKTPKWESQNWGSCYPKNLDVHIFLKSSLFDNAKEISYSLQKDLFNSVQRTPIKAHLTPAFKEFVVCSQIFNLTPAPSFDHNSCKSALNEQCEGTLSIYASRPFYWCPRDPIWSLFAFPTKVLNICNSQSGSAFRSHWAPSLALSPICESVFHT